MNGASLYNFAHRHLGIEKSDLDEMFEVMEITSLDQLVNEVVPDSIRLQRELDLPDAMSEYAFIQHMESLATKNKVYKSYLGMGYYDTITPAPILRNIFENPGWYTQYTPYQAEISQGRLEALLNFQTMVSDLTGLPLANASLLDEGTAAAEAMHMLFEAKNKRVRNPEDAANQLFISDKVFPQTIEVIRGRAIPIGIEVVVGEITKEDFNEKTFAVLLQFPDLEGHAGDYEALVSDLKTKGIYTIVAADLLSLAILTPPGEWGADVVVGNTQRFGVPMGAGGPHAAYFATGENFKRQIPGRIIGVSKDADGNLAYRMALQTREQHIKREKATSNICTAQALLAIMAGMYAVYHGPDNIRAIAMDIHNKASRLAGSLSDLGYHLSHTSFFDTLWVSTDKNTQENIRQSALHHGINLWYAENAIGVSLDETVSESDLNALVNVFGSDKGTDASIGANISSGVPERLQRKSGYLTHEVFNSYHTETALMRYIKSLENKDLSLLHSIIPLGSCTMKLNAASQLIPVSWKAFGKIHPFAPLDQTKGYTEIIETLAAYLCEITGFSACSFMPNSGAQGELAGLLTIRAYHLDKGDVQRNIALIPESAHGTNPASAVMAGMKVVVVRCDDEGNIDLEDLKKKAEEYKDNLASLMVTYPSTHGVFETDIKEICEVIHEHGGLVYMDGANMNAQVGLTSPGIIGADVCHLNLHKTFSIPHGGGGPGMGPICCNDKLAKYLPSHPVIKTGGEKGIDPVAAAPYGSASILLISYAYIRLLGREGVLEATKYALLNANYIMYSLQHAKKILYTGHMNRCAHELIVDLREFKEYGITAEDVAKRLIDYGFHAPTLSFPVAGTIMIEPTESEPKKELDRFIEAILEIRNEIEEVKLGIADPENNVLKNAPHPIWKVASDEWPYPYSRQKAAYPLPWLRYEHKFWVNVSRIDNAFGDRNLVCICPPIEAYTEEA